MKRYLLLMGIIGLGLAACKKGKADKVVAEVGKTRLTTTEFNAQIPKEYSLSPEQRVDFLNKWVNSELLYQEAHRLGLEKNDTVKTRIRQLTKEYLVNEFIQREAQKVSVSKQEMFDYFNKYKNDFLYQVKIIQILLPDQLTAQRTLDEIKAGADFKKIAAERSLDRTTAQGQESNYFGRGTGDPALEENIFSLKPGELSGVIPAPDGFHLVKLIDKKQVKKDVAFEEETEYIYTVLYYQKSRRTVESLLAEAKKKQKVELHPELLAR
jgi:parvulin-like peptidyl-prolyl isomerase